MNTAKEPLLLGIDKFSEVAKNPQMYHHKNILFSGIETQEIEDEIVITTDMSLSFDFQNEIVCKKIKILNCTVEIQGLNLRGSIVVETGILQLNLSSIHDPPPENDYLMSVHTLGGIHATKCFFNNTEKFGISVDENSREILAICKDKFHISKLTF